jgi:hypothetical protein
MGLFPILLVSLLLPHRDRGRSGTPEDPEKLAVRGGNDDNEQQRQGPGPNGHVEDDNEFNHDSDPQDDGEDEPEEPSRPGRRVTFSSPSGESSPPSEKGDEKPGFLARLKAVIFPPSDEGKPSLTPNYRLLPIISGLVIPFSILLEIPGLTDNWYIRTNGNVVVETQRNPVLLDVGLAISMFFAVVANVSLICRFLEKGPILVTTLITIASLTLHGNVSLRDFAFSWVLLLTDLINIAAVVAFGVQRRFSDGFTYGQGYWMTGMCTVPECFIALTGGFSMFYDRVDCHQPHPDI